MNNGPLLLMDTNYLCHRAFHSVGDMSFGDVGTGVLYGVFRDIIFLHEFFGTQRCVFAFDSGGKGHRSALSPVYKSSRHQRHDDETDEQKQSRADLQTQIKNLRTRYLPALGYNNVFSATGYEADDIIAKLAQGTPKTDEAVIISSDQDLWQCLRGNVWCWNPHKKRGYDRRQFIADWGIKPRQWATVKALAGCKSDDVLGIDGVGEKTVAKWLRGELKPTTKAAKKLAKSQSLFDHNIQLVRLPFNGCPEFGIVDNELTEDKWCAVMDELGMKSIRNTVPAGVAVKKGRRRGQREKGFGL